MERMNRSVVVVSGVPGPDVLPVTRMIDKLQKHFQQQSSRGDVEDVEYPTHLNGVAFVTFDNAEDAERVVRKKCHILRDKEIPEECPLTVFHFSPHVFFYVTNATVNLSEFDGDLEELIQSLRSAHGSVRIRPVLLERRATAEGPFEAIRALREDLICRADAQHGAEQVHSDVEGAAEKNGSIRSLGSDNKHSNKQRSPTEVGDNVSSTHTRADGNSASHATPHVDSKLPLPKPAYDISVSPAGIENISAKTPSCHTNSDCMNKRHKTNATVTAKPFGRSLATENTSEIDRAVTGRPDPIGAGDPGVSQRAMENLHRESIWVDSNTLSYIKQFDMRELDRRLSEHGMSLRCDEGDSDLTRVSLSGRPSAEVQSAVAHLKHLVEHWQTALRVHVVTFESMGSPERQWVFKVCDDVHARVKDVLYTVEGSCIRVVGPSRASYLFSKLVREEFEVESTFV